MTLGSKNMQKSIYINNFAGHCTCSDPTGMCVMTAVSAHPPPTHWSSCSISDLASGFKYKKLHRCLHNEPEAAAIEPVCGNGYREIGEVCDCGTSEVTISICFEDMKDAIFPCSPL